MARIYYVRNDDGSIGRTSNLLSVARDNGFDDTYTDEEINRIVTENFRKLFPYI